MDVDDVNLVYDESDEESVVNMEISDNEMDPGGGGRPGGMDEDHQEALGEPRASPLRGASANSLTGQGKDASLRMASANS